jgi:2-oxoglutarate dehydrogenase complex dehydrogenase (E1) component-like enzyme
MLERLAGGRPVSLVARPPSSSPAEGSAALHARVQEDLVGRAFGQLRRSNVEVRT